METGTSKTKLPHNPTQAAPLPPSLADVPLDLVSPRILSLRLRSTVVQLVLLSPEPLRPSALYALYKRVVDDETARLFDCASRAVRLCTVADAAASTGKQPSSAAAAVEAGAEASRESADKEAILSIGRAFIEQYRHSVVPLGAALQRADGLAKCVVNGVSRVPPAHDVVRWMLLHLLFTDAEFRVSAYSGAVCYPTLPSLLLVTSDYLPDSNAARECYRLQWAKTSSLSAPAPAAATPAMESAYTSSHFRWLNGAAGHPPWTLAHAEFTIYDAFVSRRQKVGEGASPTPESNAGSVATDEPSSSPPSTAAAVLAGSGATSGHRLVDYFIHLSPSTRLARDASDDKAAAKAFPFAGWNEGTRGSSTVQQYAADLATLDGVLGFHLWRYPTLRQPSGELYQFNTQLISGIARHLTSVPISVARLSTALRWNVSIYDAGIYRSFLYLLLTLGANPTVHHMDTAVQQRVRATTRCVELWGGGVKSTNNGGSRGAAAAAAAAAEKEVRQALMALDTPPPPSPQPRTAASSGDAPEALRAAFAAEAKFVRAYPLSDRNVTELLCLRVLPHARPAAPRTRRSAASNDVDFCGFRLQYVEVLPTWCRTPEEILNDLRAKHCAEMHKEGAKTAAAAAATAEPDRRWLEAYEEPYVLVCARSTVMVRGRLKAAADAFAAIVTSGPMTLRQLSIIVLWAHEFGTAMASEMLFVVLLLNPSEARLHPPASSVRGKEGGGGYEEWTVDFL